MTNLELLGFLFITDIFIHIYMASNEYFPGQGLFHIMTEGLSDIINVMQESESASQSSSEPVPSPAPIPESTRVSQEGVVFAEPLNENLEEINSLKNRIKDLEKKNEYLLNEISYLRNRKSMKKSYQSDINLIMNQVGVNIKLAADTLKSNNGDVVAAIKELYEKS